METTDTQLTEVQEQFLALLTASTALCISMDQIQKKFVEIESKAQTKRDIESLITNKIISRQLKRMVVGGRITSATLYQLL